MPDHPRRGLYLRILRRAITPAASRHRLTSRVRFCRRSADQLDQTQNDEQHDDEQDDDEQDDDERGGLSPEDEYQCGEGYRLVPLTAGLPVPVLGPGGSVIGWLTAGSPRRDDGIDLPEEGDQCIREERRADQRQDLRLRPPGPAGELTGDRPGNLPGPSSQPRLPIATKFHFGI